MRPASRPVLALALLGTVFLARAALADDITAESHVSDVTLYPSGAAIERQAHFDVTPGAHRLIITDMPTLDPASLRLSAPGLVIGAVAYRDDVAPPQGADDTAAITAAEARVKDIRARIDKVQDAAAGYDQQAANAAAQLGFLADLGRSGNAFDADPQRVQAVLDMIGTKGLALRQAQAEAQQKARGVREGLKPLETELAAAQKALDTLRKAQSDRSFLTVEVDAKKAAEGTLSIRYVTTQAGWQPVYDVSLDTTGETPDMTIDRGARVHQATGEDWTGVHMTLSTARPSGQADPGEVAPQPLRISDPKAAPAASAPVLPMLKSARVEAAPTSDNGVTVNYDYPRPVSLATGGESLKLELGEMALSPDVYAAAVPLKDDTAFLMADFTNSGGAPLLASDKAQFFLDGTYIGSRHLNFLADGEKASWSFGPIDGLRLKRVSTGKTEGDSGIIRKSNELKESARIDISNLTGRSWPLVVTDRVPYAQQEDLKVTWQADPMPTEENADGRPGVLQWRFPIPAHSDKTITISHHVSWPEGKVLTGQ